jgi:hypothetical protein
VWHVGQQAATGLALDQADEGLLASGADQRVAFPMADATAGFDAARASRNRTAVRDLPASILARGVAFAALLLAAQMAPEFAACSFVGVDALIKRLVADR